MSVNEEILETIQQIGGIFQTKGIPAAPVNLDYLEEKVAPGMEKLVVTELIMHLDDLLAEYIKEDKKVHKFARYADSFKSILESNSDGSSIIGRKVA